MEEAKKFYSQRAISITTFFGGPLAAGILMRQNYLNLGKDKAGLNSLFLGVISTIFICAGLIALPDATIDKIPSQLIPFIYTGIIFFIVEKTQGKKLKEHKENKGEFYSGWKAAKIGALSLVAIIATVATVAFFTGDLSNTEPDFDAETYDNGLEQFFINEETSMQVFNDFETEPLNYLIKEVNNNIELWKENKEIIDNIDQIENLPQEFIDQDKLLRDYSLLRIEHFELILKAIGEDTDKYNPQIEAVGSRIDMIIDELDRYL